MTTKPDAASTPPTPPPTPAKTSPDVRQTHVVPARRLDDLYALDAQLAALPDTAASSEKRAELLAQRSRTRLAFGFSELAVEDMTEAHAIRARSSSTCSSSTPRYVDDARFAEALRIDARDRLLSKTNANELFAAVDKSIGLFRAAAKAIAEAKGVEPKQEAWVNAHLAAAQTMNFWIIISENPFEACKGLGADAFREAEAHFLRAVALDPEYPWALRFRAHLHALRGDKGDFEIAIDCLKRADAIEQASARRSGSPAAAAGVESQQSSFQRSLSMLFSYVAVQSDSAEAALQSITAGLQALTRDPDELHAPHSIVASLFWLAHYGPEADRAKHAAYLQPAIDAAYLHARNTASRASGVLASLALMEGLQKNRDVTLAAVKAKRILDGFAQMGIPVDLETRAFSYRTPSVALLEKHLATMSDERAELLRRTFKPMLEYLTFQLAIPNPARPRAGQPPPTP